MALENAELPLERHKYELERVRNGQAASLPTVENDGTSASGDRIR